MDPGIVAPLRIAAAAAYLQTKGSGFCVLLIRTLPAFGKVDIFSPTRLACRVLTFKKAYQLGLFDRPVPPSHRTGSPVMPDGNLEIQKSGNGKKNKCWIWPVPSWD